MSQRDLIEIFLFLGALLGLTPLLGKYIAAVFSDTPSLPHRVLGPIENLCYRIAGIDPKEEMGWKTYLKALLLFNFFGFVALFLLQIFQGVLPLNPQAFPSVPWQLAFNTAASFVTNTNWQSYSGETTLSYLTQMLGLGVQNFLSAATGMGALLALIRGILRSSSDTIGNFWQDLVRTTVYLLLPLSILLALALMGEGVVQTFSPYVEVTTIEGGKQTIPLGPAASQVAIKQLGTNGGGFFNANSAHPFENPSAFSNYLEMLAILLIPAATLYAYGTWVGSTKHGWLIFFVMFTLWAAGTVLSIYAEHQNNPVMGIAPLLEGKETRFGITNSLIWSTATSATSNGSVSAMMSSLSPLAGGVALFNIMLGEIIFGGVGVGLSSMIMFIIFTVFLSGLMVGRTPEYLGKKIGRQEMQWVVMAILMPGALILIGAGISSILPSALTSLSTQGPHGLTEILYAFSSAAGNNGSSFAGLNANTNYFNLALGIVMLMGRIAILLPALAIAGALAKKKTTPPSLGTFSTDSPLFAFLLMGTILIVGGLTFFPALSLGPIIEHLLMVEGRSF